MLLLPTITYLPLEVLPTIQPKSGFLPTYNLQQTTKNAGETIIVWHLHSSWLLPSSFYKYAYSATTRFLARIFHFGTSCYSGNNDGRIGLNRKKMSLRKMLVFGLLCSLNQVVDGDLPFRPIVSTVDWLISLATDLSSNVFRDVRDVDDGYRWQYADSNFFITGTSSGIGWELASTLLSCCNELTLHCRPSKLLGMKESLLSNGSRHRNPKEKMVGIDLCEVETIPNAVNTLDDDPIDVLIHNAGLMSAEAWSL